jgi:proline iminopeptidase
VEIEVNGTSLWFDVEGPALVPAGDRMSTRPTVVLVHGGPGGYDHSYFKPQFARLATTAQVVYLDLRDHGRSVRNDPADWTFEVCADDLRVFCDALRIERPIVFGHSMGGIVSLLYGLRHPGHAGGLILQSAMARFDLDRLVEGFRRVGGDRVAELARRSYTGEEVSDAEWSRVFACFGPGTPGPAALARRVRNPDVGPVGMDCLRNLDALDLLRQINSPSLVCVGDLDPVTPVSASEEIFACLRPGVGRLSIVPGCGHFPWLDAPDRWWPVIEAFVRSVAA